MAEDKSKEGNDNPTITKVERLKEAAKQFDTPKPVIVNNDKLQAALTGLKVNNPAIETEYNNITGNPTLVIAAFPGMGKSYLRRHAKKKLNVLDLDSKLYDKTSSLFPGRYLADIEDALQRRHLDIILVSTHKSVLKGLEARGIKYSLVHPGIGAKNTYLARYLARMDDEEFIRMVDSKWEEFFDDLFEANPDFRLVPSDNAYLSDYINYDTGKLTMHSEVLHPVDWKQPTIGIPIGVKKWEPLPDSISISWRKEKLAMLKNLVKECRAELFALGVTDPDEDDEVPKGKPAGLTYYAGTKLHSIRGKAIMGAIYDEIQDSGRPPVDKIVRIDEIQELTDEEISSIVVAQGNEDSESDTYTELDVSVIQDSQSMRRAAAEASNQVSKNLQFEGKPISFRDYPLDKKVLHDTMKEEPFRIIGGRSMNKSFLPALSKATIERVVPEGDSIFYPLNDRVDYNITVEDLDPETKIKLSLVIDNQVKEMLEKPEVEEMIDKVLNKPVEESVDLMAVHQKANPLNDIEKVIDTLPLNLFALTDDEICLSAMERTLFTNDAPHTRELYRKVFAKDDSVIFPSAIDNAHQDLSKDSLEFFGVQDEDLISKPEESGMNYLASGDPMVIEGLSSNSAIWNNVAGMNTPYKTWDEVIDNERS